MGFVRIDESAGPPKRYTLVYQAPDVTRDELDAVTYELGGASHEVQVRITPATQPPTLTSGDLYNDSFRALFVLFILAVVLESGLSVIFNWRPFVEFFDSRGVKTIVMLVFAYFFVETFSLDIATRLVNVYSGTDYPVNFPGKLVTALVLAGGSSGVNNLMVALGFRSMRRREQVMPRPKAQDAWIAVRLIRDKAVGPVYVLIGAPGGSYVVAGTITGTSKGNSGLRYFIRDQGRFPTSGGHPVKAGAEYLVRLEGVDENGSKVSAQDWGPYALAEGAIVDLEFTL